MQVVKRTALVQDMVYLRSRPLVNTSTNVAECYVCGKGLEHGYSVTAKTLANGTVLFCNVHFSLQ